MDDTDAAILEHLKRDGRAHYTAVADAIGASEATVRKRVDRMQEEGVIRRFTVSTSVGNVRAMIEVGVDVDVETGAVSDAIVEWDGVDFVWEVSGDGDLIAVVDAADTAAVNDLVTEIRQLDGTESTKTRLILDEKI